MARGDEDELSPTTIILNSLRAKGLPPNAENIRRAVAQMGRQPDEAGPDPVAGLRVQRTDDNVGQGGGSVAGKVEGGGQSGNAGDTKAPTGPAEPRNYENIGGGSDNSGSKTTSAQPSNSMNLGGAIAAGAGIPLAFDWLTNRGGGLGAEATEPWNVPLRGPIDVSPDALPGARVNPALAGPGGPQLGAPSLQLGGPTPQIAGPDAAQSPMEMAMQKALAPPAGVPQLGGPGEAPAIRLPDQTSGPTIPLPPPEPPASVGGGAAGRPTVTIETNPQLSGRPSPINPQITSPGAPEMTLRPTPKLSGRPPPIDFRNIGKLGRYIR